MTDSRATVDGRDLEAIWTDDAPETKWPTGNEGCLY